MHWPSSVHGEPGPRGVSHWPLVHSGVAHWPFTTHCPPGGRDDLGNPGTHLTGADHEDPLEAHRSSLPRAASEARRCRSRLTE